MSRIVRFFKALQNNPKKTVFFGAVSAVGIHYGKGKYDDENLMREYCEEALGYGEAIHKLGDKERHITVILNPAANEGKARHQFGKYCAPLLHLAGLKVALVKTEHEGQARDYMDIMENTSAVVVAGGDGTLAEVVTGLMRRSDNKQAAKKLPLGILPLGTKNNTASSIWEFDNQPSVKHLGEATMAVIKNIKRPLDVMEITPLASTTEDLPKPVYALSEIEWSAYRDAYERRDKYWYYPFVKKYATYVFSTYKDISWNCDADIEYKLPCSGCSNCVSSKVDTPPEEIVPSAPQRKWWQSFLPKFSVQKIKDDEDDDDYIEEDTIDRSTIINENCGTIEVHSIKDVCDLRLSSKNLKSTNNLPSHTLVLRTGQENISSLDFIREGWNRLWNKEYSHSNEIKVGEITIRPHEDAKKNKSGEDRELSLDNENFEVRPMKIRALPKALRVFAPREISTSA